MSRPRSARPRVEELETRDCPAIPAYAIGVAQPGPIPQVQVYDDNNQLIANFSPLRFNEILAPNVVYSSVTVAVGFVTGNDGTPDVIVCVNPVGLVRIFDGTRLPQSGTFLTADFLPPASEFTGFPGYVGTLNLAVLHPNTGGDDLIVLGTAQGVSGVRLVSIRPGGQAVTTAQFLAFNAPTGVNITTGNLDGGGVNELIVSQAERGNVVIVISGTFLAEVQPPTLPTGLLNPATWLSAFFVIDSFGRPVQGVGVTAGRFDADIDDDLLLSYRALDGSTRAFFMTAVPPGITFTSDLFNPSFNAGTGTALSAIETFSSLTDSVLLTGALLPIFFRFDGAALLAGLLPPFAVEFSGPAAPFFNDVGKAPFGLSGVGLNV